LLRPVLAVLPRDEAPRASGLRRLLRDRADDSARKRTAHRPSAPMVIARSGMLTRRNLWQRGPRYASASSSSVRSRGERCIRLTAAFFLRTAALSKGCARCAFVGAASFCGARKWLPKMETMSA
jgi:hypothetical protein